jgi:hypothetical protein
VTIHQPRSDEQSARRSHLFLIRIWKEEGHRGMGYRGNIRGITSGATRNFRNWSDVTAFMTAQVEEHEELVAGHADQPALERNL